MIDIRKIEATTFEVVVNDATRTLHRVTLSAEYYQKLTAGHLTAEDLIRKSFEFLLEREPNTSILGTFDLQMIGRYFPEYERVILRE